MGTPLTLTPSVASTPLRMSAVRLFHAAVGAWVADCVLDLQPAQTAPSSGAVTLSVGGVPMSGTIDARSSGAFGPSARVRVVAGAGGWDQIVPRQYFAADNGVLSTTVYQQTAAIVGETVVDAAPVLFPVAFTRTLGPARRVFRDLPWWVDTSGVTHTGARPSSTADASLLVRDFDALAELLSASCDALVLPGTTIADARLPAPVVAGDVEQLFDAQGSHVWVSTAPVGLVDDLKAATLEWTRAAQLRVYRYRLVLYKGTAPGGGPPRMALQAVTPSAGVPDMVPFMPWSGLAGAVNELAPSQEVLVAFENADPTLPRVVGYSLLGTPKSTTIDATSKIAIGPSSTDVELAGGGPAVGRVGDSVSVDLYVTMATISGVPVVSAIAPAPVVGGVKITVNGTITSGSSKAKSG